jgi:ketosteroid isomerase-like protein
MSEENVEFMRRAVDAYNRGDLEGFGELLDPDVLWKPDPSWPEVRARHGREEVLQLLADVREPLDRNETVLENFVDAGDRVVFRQVWRGVLKGTDDEVEGTLGVIVTFREGKVTEVRYFSTFDDALEAAGLSK